VSPSKAPAEELDVDGVAVRMSNPDKIYYPQLGADGGRKRDLVEYYRAVALDGAILRAIGDRPTYLQRFPDGVDGEEVYQKRVPKFAPDYVGLVRVRFPSGREADAMHVTHPATVVWAANLGTVTFHSWHARVEDPEHPDQFRLDLDPQPAASFADARAVAVGVVRERLAEHGFVGFPKTSGGRGIHVYVKIEPRWNFTQVRRRGDRVARDIERHSAGAVTTSWWKEERQDSQIFIDFNQKPAGPHDRVGVLGAADRAGDGVDAADLGRARPTPTRTTSRSRRCRPGWPRSRTRWRTWTTSRTRWRACWRLADRDAAAGLEDLPYPPNYPKMPGEPKRVQPSRSRGGHGRKPGRPKTPAERGR
jgi:DNA ligase D-like protein (predicted polymerase)